MVLLIALLLGAPELRLPVELLTGLDPLGGEVALVIEGASPSEPQRAAPSDPRITAPARTGPRVFMLDPVPGDRAAREAAAREAGAEWLLVVADGIGRLYRIDDGLWAPAGPGVLERSVVLETPAAETPSGPGEPRVLGRVRGVVLALAECPLPGGPALLALTVDTLYAYRPGRGLEPLTTLDALARAEVRTRDPVGGIACRDDALWIGHSALASSVRLGPEFRSVETAAGIPLAFRGDRLVLGETLPGTNVWSGRLHGPSLELRLGQTFAQILPGPGPEWWAVTRDLRLVALRSDGSRAVEAGPTGVGAAIGPGGQRLLTSTEAGPADRLVLGERSFVVQGPVRASTFGAQFGFVVSVQHGPESELLALDPPAGGAPP